MEGTSFEEKIRGKDDEALVHFIDDLVAKERTQGGYLDEFDDGALDIAFGEVAIRAARSEED